MIPRKRIYDKSVINYCNFFTPYRMYVLALFVQARFPPVTVAPIVLRNRTILLQQSCYRAINASA